MNDKIDQEKKEMLARANLAVKSVAKEFTVTLKERVSDLESAIKQNDRKFVVQMSYDLETEASTFGWPRVTRICKWLRQVFSGDYDQKPEAEDILQAINALKLMVSNPENPNEQRDMELFKELYPKLKRVVSDI